MNLYSFGGITMNRIPLAAAVAAALLLTTGGARAAIYNVVASFSGGSLGPVSFDVTIDADFSTDIADTTPTINSLTSVPDGGLVYGYMQSVDRLNIGGGIAGSGGVLSNANDFVVSIGNLQTSPYLNYLNDSSQADGFGNPTLDSLTVTRLPDAQVPLPAGLPLLLSGLSVLAVASRARRRKAAAA